MRLLSKTGPNLACLLLLTHASFLFLSHIPSISIPVLSLSSAMMQQIRSSQAEMCWRNHRSSTWDCWARLDQIWLVCFFSHMPPFYSFPIFQASASLCCRTCGWVLKFDIGVVTQYGYDATNSLQPSWDVPHEIAEQDWTKFGLFASSHTCLLSIPFPYSKHQHPCAVALAGGCWNLTAG